MNFQQQQETEAERQHRLEKLALQRLAADEAQREQQRQLAEQQQRLDDTNRAVQDHQQLVAQIQALIPANTEAAAACLRELDSATASKTVDFWHIGDLLEAVDKTIEPLTPLIERARGIGSWWTARQPNFDAHSPILTSIGMKHPFAPLPQPVTSRDVLQEWVSSSPPEQIRLRETIRYYFNGAPDPASSFTPGRQFPWDRG